MYGDIVELGLSTSSRTSGREDGEMIRGRGLMEKSRILLHGTQFLQTRLQEARDRWSQKEMSMSHSSCGKTDMGVGREPWAAT